MASGVSVNDQCLEAFQELKRGKKTKFIVFKLSDDNTQIVVDKTSTSKEYDDFVADLPETDCRYAVYDFEFSKGDEGTRNKIVFISWSPDDARIKPKMLYASSREALRRALVGAAVEIQATAFDEIAYENVLEKASRGS